jgi:hypothetical protein
MGGWSKFKEATWLTSTYSSSAANTKSRGERGSSCLTPLLHLKRFPGTPFSRTVVDLEFRILSIELIQISGRPSWAIINKITWCSTRSKAFSKSNYRIIAFLLEWWHWWMYSKHQTRQSWIVLVQMKPYWFLCTRLLISLCNLSARILIISLGEIFIKEMGL